MQKVLVLVLLLFTLGCKEKDIRPKADFSFTQYENGLVIFKNASTNAVDYLWSFSDGIGAVEADPQHRYKSNGEFDVKLTIKNNQGDTDQISKRVSVRSVP
ncbi:PKD domain-containing protein [Spirosoma pomorum]